MMFAGDVLCIRVIDFARNSDLLSAVFEAAKISDLSQYLGDPVLPLS